MVEPTGWGALHDLILIYLSFMHGSQAVTGSINPDKLVVKIHAWQPHKDPRYIRRVLMEVMLIYISHSNVQMLEMSVMALREALPEHERIKILRDIADMVCQEGLYYPDDANFIEHIAREWEVEHCLVA